MAVSRTFTVNLGTGATGASLVYKVFDTANAQVGSTSSAGAGVVEAGGGWYGLTAAYPEGTRGTLRVYLASAPTVPIAATAINPEEFEYLVNFATVPLDGGTVDASPAPTPTTFSSTSATLLGATGTYNYMNVELQSSAGNVRRTLFTHTRTDLGGGVFRHDFAILGSPNPPFPAAPAATTPFILM